jgi:hypothetical protein
VLGALAQSDESDVGAFASGHRSDVLHVDLPGDDLVAEGGDDGSDEREPILALIGDQDAEMIRSIGERLHAPILESVDELHERLPLGELRLNRSASQCSSGSSDLAGVRETSCSRESETRQEPCPSTRIS